MEESQHLMWMKRRQMLKSHIQAPVGGCNNSWEERAFAEDTARILGVGGCIWPPRSYSCTFCKKEFRSAQALGGHMNVHRRDRARLKQNTSRPNDCMSLGTQFSSEICSQLDHFLNPSSTITTSTLSPSRLSSAISTKENCSHQKIVPSCASIGWMQHRSCPNYSEPEGFKGLSCDHVETDLSVGLNSMFGRKLPSGSSCRDDGAISCKRPKTSISSLKPCSNDRLLAFHSAEIVLGLKPGMEDLDLELRLGKPQKVK